MRGKAIFTMKTALGLILGFFTLLFTHLSNGGSVGDLIQPVSLVFVLVATLLSTGFSVSLSDLKRALFGVPGATFLEGAGEGAALRKELVDLAGIARKEGLLALDPYRASASRESLRDGIQYLISGFEAGAISELFEASIRRRASEGERVARVWEIAAQASPSIGALGATLGLLTSLARLDDPESLGRGIASAMACVLYGFFFSNFVFSPAAVRARTRAEGASLPDEAVKAAVLGIHEGLNPHLIEERIKQVLSL